MAEQRDLSPTQHPPGVPVPAHLAGWLGPLDWVEDAPSITGDLICPCGGRAFELLHPGKTHRPGRLPEPIPCTVKIPGRPDEFNHWLAIDVVCVGCWARAVVFDSMRHGYAMFLAADRWQRQVRPTLVPWACSGCGGRPHRGRVRFHFPERDDFLAEFAGRCGAERWADGFDYFEMRAECASCGHRVEPWAGFESD